MALIVAVGALQTACYSQLVTPGATSTESGLTYHIPEDFIAGQYLVITTEWSTPGLPVPPERDAYHPRYAIPWGKAAERELKQVFKNIVPVTAGSQQNLVVIARATIGIEKGSPQGYWITSEVRVGLYDNQGNSLGEAVGESRQYALIARDKAAYQNALIVGLHQALFEIFRGRQDDEAWLKQLEVGRLDLTQGGALFGSLDTIGAGTGFLINPAGDLVTAAHVVSDCLWFGAVVGDVEYAATLAFIEEQLDLAVLRVEFEPPSHATFAGSPEIPLGQDVAAFGYPLPGLLTTSPSITTGIVSSPSISRDVPEYMVVTTPIQPGNSGGPLLSLDGAVLGMVVGALNPVVSARMTGTLPQNVNFALNETSIVTVLDEHGVTYERGSSGNSLGTVELAQKAKEFTVQVLCKR